MNAPVIAVGMLVGAGVAGLIHSFARRTPHLGDALQRLSPTQQSSYAEQNALSGISRTERLGYTMHGRIANLPGLRIPTADLQLLGRSTGWFIGRKITVFLLGLLLAPMLSLLLAIVGSPVPLAIPALIGPLMGITFWFLPDLEVAGQAKEGRRDHGRAVIAYIELVSLHLVGGVMPSQALDDAARIGTGHVFARLTQELDRATWEREPKWRALQRLSKELDLPELGDLANIAQLAEEEGAEVARAMQERAKDLIKTQLTKEKNDANVKSEKIWAPATLLSTVFGAILITPMIITIASGG
jgi:Flp pilus assembly protein TadB